MKKKLLASVLTSLGMVGAAHAVHVNTDGLGQVLLYPYYTVQDGFDTYVHVVNTTTQVKAVKVRFLEGKNSQEVLDFNLYLSPKDEWTAVVTATADGAQVSTTDTSCTAPQLTTEEFRTTRFNTDTGNNSKARTREGYIEIIEMGVVPAGAEATAATHTSAGVPANCATVRAAASAGGNLQNIVVERTGGLYGFNTLINVNAGMATTIDAVALDDFDPVGLHTAPGSLQPSLEQVVGLADILDGNQVVNFIADTGNGRPAIDAISAVLMRTNVINDYVVAPEIAAETDWVVTFPTKRFYVNGSTPVEPFTSKWSSLTAGVVASVGLNGTLSCDAINIEYFDREERTTVVEDDFSPQDEVLGASLCNEVNTIKIGESDIFGAVYTEADLPVVFTSGWADITFAGTNALAGIDGANGVNVVGLPYIGFAAMSFTNGTLQVDGVNVLSNYLGTSVHKGQRLITTAP